MLSGKTVSSEFIKLRYKDRILTRIIDEECENLSETDRVRAKRGLKSPLPYLKQVKKLWKPVKKVMKPAGKLVWRGLKTGTKHFPVDLSLDLLEFAIERNWDASEAVKSNDDFDKNERRVISAEQIIELQMESFRSDLKVLLNNGIIQGLIRETPAIQKISNEVMAPELKASEMKCIKDDFTEVYSLRLRVDIEETLPVVARKCGDIGEIHYPDDENVLYKYYEFPDNFLVDRNGKTYSVNTTLCSKSSPIFCPENSLHEESCSVMSTQTCKEIKLPLNAESKIIRSLPIGYSFYGPFKDITLKRNKKESKYRLNPFNLEYIRLPEGVDIQLGDTVFHS